LNSFFKFKSLLKAPVINLFVLMKRNRKKQLLYLIFFMLFCALVEAVCVPITISFLNNIVGDGSSDGLNKLAIKFFNTEDSFLLLFFTGLSLIILNFLNAFLRIVNVDKYTQFSASMGTELSMKIYKSALYNSYQKHLDTNVSELLNISTMAIQRTVVSIIMLTQLLTSFFIAIFLTLSLFLVDWKNFLIVFVIFVSFYLLITYLTKIIYNKNSILINQYSEKQLSFLQESMGFFVDIVLRSKQDNYIKKYMNIDKPMRELISKNIFYTNRPKFIIESIGIALIISIVLINISAGNSLGNTFTLLGIFVLAYQRLLPLINQIYTSYSVIAFNQDSVRSVINMIKSSNIDSKNSQEIYKDNLSNKKINEFNNIKFDSVYYSYDNSDKNKISDFILEDVSLSIRNGEKIGIIGETGSGKSTFINLIMGLLQPSNGNVIVDGYDISKSNSPFLKSWQSLISYVPQKTYLANKTIAENIAIDEEISDIDFDKLELSTEKANIKKFIVSKPNTFFTNAGERGTQLSGGQVQRIALARAFYNESKVLVFDEATSALDKDTEEKVMDNLFSKLNNKTLILISHRISSLKKCDRFFKVENKKIKELKISDLK